MITWWARLAVAGCAVDPLEDEHLGAEGFVGVGEVVALETSSEGQLRIRQVVRIDRALEGRVASGFVALVTPRSLGTCPGDLVYAPGDVVWVVGTPQDGEVAVSPCRRSTGLYDASREAWLAGLAQPVDVSVTFAGAPPPAFVAPGGFPAAGERRVRLGAPAEWGLTDADRRPSVRSEPVEGRVFATTATRVGAVWEGGGLELALWVDRSGLAEAVVEGVAVPGAALAPGAPIHLVDGVPTYDQGGIRILAPIGAALGTEWVPAPLPMVEPNAVLVRAVDVDGADNSPVATLAAGTWVRAAAPRRGRVELAAGGGYATVRGWIDADALAVGGVEEGASSTRGLVPTLELRPGLDLVVGGRTVGRTTGVVDVPVLAIRGDVAWIEVPGPLGAFAAAVRCPAPGEGTCEP